MWQPRCLSCDERGKSHGESWLSVETLIVSGFARRCYVCPVHPSFPPPAARLRLKLNMTLNEEHLPLTGHVSIDFSPQWRQSAWQNLLHYRLQITILNCNQGRIRLDCSTAAKHNLCLTPRRHSLNSTICTTKCVRWCFSFFFYERQPYHGVFYVIKRETRKPH